MARSLASGKPESNSGVPAALLDAISGPLTGARPLETLLQYRPACLTVSDQDALTAMSAAFETLKLVVEPGGAAALGAVMANKKEFKGKTVAVVCSGGNVDPDVFAKAILYKGH
ncbi:Phenylserine dehydratase [compost metagenome]